MTTGWTGAARFARTAFLGALTLLLPAIEAFATGIVHHELVVRLFPEDHRLDVLDTLTLPDSGGGTLTFTLHEGLEPRSRTEGITILRGNGAETYTAVIPPGVRSFSVEYKGVINHPLEPYGREQARGFMVTRGIISPEGVYLSGASAWYPVIEGKFLTFSMEVIPTEGWLAVSQGNRESAGDKIQRWETEVPQDEIYLVAAPFTLYADHAGRIETLAYLRAPDPGLAATYLETTAQYLELYERLIGPYPYGKFALVENFWETGWGMPSFTLLGSRIIRFPFILHSSYPHEILHNWWGNSVYPAYETGNWSEGLTAYLADHLVKEQRGTGAEHRLTVLQKYADYVSGQKDFPLTAFTSRHSTSSEAVGYGKSLMFFHMLRGLLGDEVFSRGLQTFYRANRFRTASFEELQAAFEEVSDLKLAGEFRQWTTRSGAPELALGPISYHLAGKEHTASVRIEQVQTDAPYVLRVPLVFTLDGDSDAYRTVLTVRERVSEAEIALPGRPLRLDVDPEFDLFRRVGLRETPPAITQVLGAEKMLVLLPAEAPEPERLAYQDLAAALAGAGPDTVEIRRDTEMEVLPADGAVCVLGATNRFRDLAMSAVAPAYNVRFEKDVLQLAGATVPREDHSLVLVGRRPQNPALPVMWIVAEPPEAAPGLGRKLPHYHKYSYLAFEGTEPENILKGRWPVENSPMTAFFPGEDGTREQVPMAKLPARTPLASMPVPFSRDAMMETAGFLSDPEQEGRAPGTGGAERAAGFISQRFREAGLSPAGDANGSYFQSWQATGYLPDGPGTLRNVLGMIPGRSGGCVVVGAHYDHLGNGWPEPREERFRGQLHPGADDNASGVAILLELARVLGKTMKPERTVMFAAFAAEEAGRLGSRYFVENPSACGPDGPFAMLNLDTVGRLGAGKLLVLGGASASEWVHIFRGVGYITGVEIQLVAEPLDTSDQQSFIHAGIPAVQLFTGPHPDYHRPSDTTDKLDAEGLVKVASVAEETIEYLASRKEPLTVVNEAAPVPGGRSGTRKVSLGIVPDFGFRGEGCRLAGVIAGSPAERAGLGEGDVIFALDEDPVGNLRDLSAVLKDRSPGQEVTILFRRDGIERSARVVLVAR